MTSNNILSPIMPLKNYGVLKGSVVDRRLGTGQNAHYQIQIADSVDLWRIAVNVKSAMQPSEVQYLIADPFQHPILDGLKELALGFHKLPSKPGGLAVDFIRGNFIPDFRDMVPLPFDVAGLDNDLNEKVDAYIQRAMSDEDAVLYAFGETWGPETLRDKIFGFVPGRGIHDIHMNQGNSGQFKSDDGVWQDGAVMIHFPARDQWVGVFLKFQSQDIHTDDQTGHARPIAPGGPPSDVVPPIPAPGPGELPTAINPDGWVRIVAALVNDTKSPEQERVTLINTGVQEIDIEGWMIADKQKAKMKLTGKIGAGQTRLIDIVAPVALSNKGGIISLLDASGTKVHGVTYTKDEVKNPGWTIVF